MAAVLVPERALPHQCVRALVFIVEVLVVLFVGVGGLEPEDEDGGGVGGEEPAVEVPGDPDAAAPEVQPLAAAELPPEAAHLERLLAVDGDPHGGVLDGEGHLVRLARDVDRGSVGLAGTVGDGDLAAGEEETRGRGRPLGGVADGQRELAVDREEEPVPGRGLRPAARGGEAGAREVPRERHGAAAREGEPLGPAPPPREPRPEREPRGRRAVLVTGEAELRGQEQADRGARPRQRDGAEVRPVDGRRRGGRRSRRRIAAAATAAGEAGERHGGRGVRGAARVKHAGRGKYGGFSADSFLLAAREGVVVAPVRGRT